MGDQQDHEEKDQQGRYQHGPDVFPLTGGNQFAPVQRRFDTQAPPQRSGAIVATTLGLLVRVGLVVWFLLP